MNYPFWEIPYLGSGWVIGIIAIFHVMISQFAVGGGLYLPMAERKAMRCRKAKLRSDWLKQLAGFSKFFLILTAVFGTVSGVGIWFAIGLTHPEATSTLIHNFVFGWAMEWVFFLVELTTILVYYNTWDRIDPKLHLAVGWVYAVASAFTLIIINGILTFMLTPGDTWLRVAGTGHEASKFWYAFFNPTYWPSLFLRACVCCALAGIWALITASRIDGEQAPRPQNHHGAVERQVAGALLRRHALPPHLVPLDGSRIAAGIAHSGHRHHRLRNFFHHHPHRPAHHRHLGHHRRRRLLPRLSQSHRLQSLPRHRHSAAGAHRHRLRRVRPRDAAQALRHRQLDVLQRRPRPYVSRINQEDYLANTMWVWNKCNSAHPWSNSVGDPQFLTKPDFVAYYKCTQVESTSSYSRGEAIFRGECGSCHTLNGYRPLKSLLAGRDRANITSFITMLHDYKPDSPYRRYMPPMAGTKQDIDDLADFLNAQVNPPQKPVQTAQR
jgi:cytochrome d ubiquinol oxidase subunit I